ncbi:MAG: hypothetical protein WC489_02645 [Patescibacteria group bacterium]
MKKQVKKVSGVSVLSLEKDIASLRHEIALKTIEDKVNPQKDSNFLRKKRKELAVLLTLLQQKKIKEKLEKSIT